MEATSQLESRLAKLEYHVRILIELADTSRDPFLFHMIEAGATEGQVEAIYDLMDELRDSIYENKALSQGEFKRRVYAVFPEKSGDFHFAEGIIGTLYRARKYESVYKYMQQSGMNI